MCFLKLIFPEKTIEQNMCLRNDFFRGILYSMVQHFTFFPNIMPVSSQELVNSVNINTYLLKFKKKSLVVFISKHFPVKGQEVIYL